MRHIKRETPSIIQYLYDGNITSNLGNRNNFTIFINNRSSTKDHLTKYNYLLHEKVATWFFFEQIRDISAMDVYHYVSYKLTLVIWSKSSPPSQDSSAMSSRYSKTNHYQMTIQIGQSPKNITNNKEHIKNTSTKEVEAKASTKDIKNNEQITLRIPTQWKCILKCKK